MSKLKSIIRGIKNKALGCPVADELIYSKRLQDAFNTASVTGGSIAGKVVMITGGTGGIGRAMAVRFLAEDCNVIITGRNENKLKKSVEYIKGSSRNKNISYEIVDQCSEEDISRISKKYFSKQSCIVDILINNAGLFTDNDRQGRLLSVNREDFMRMWETNFIGMKKLSSAFAESHSASMVSSGTLINIASICAEFPHFQYTTYGISKSAVVGFSHDLQSDFPSIKVHIIEPGAIATNMGYLGIGSNIAKIENNTINHVIIPEQIAAIAAFLASRAGSCVQMPVVASAGEVL